MAHRVKIIDGKAPSGGTGGVSAADFSEAIVDFFSKGVVKKDDYKVEEQGTPNMTVKVNTGNAYVPNPAATMLFATELDASANVTIGANASGNPRIDAIVIRVDTGTTPNNFANNVVSLMAVQGTPAGSPVAPDDAAIQTAVGAANGFYRIANVRVENAATSIANSKITSTREGVVLRVTGGYLRYNLATSKLQYSNDGTNFSDISGTPNMDTSSPQSLFTSSSNSAVDVPGATKTINPTTTVKVMAIISGRSFTATPGDVIRMSLVIDGSIVQEIDVSVSDTNYGQSFCLSGQAHVSAGSRVIKMRALNATAARSFSIDQANVSLLWG